MASARFKIDKNDIVTAIRHTVIPVVAGAGMAAVDTLQSGTVDIGTAKVAFTTALVSGFVRLFQRWMSDLQKSQ